MFRGAEGFQRVRGDRTADRRRMSFCPARCEAEYASGHATAKPGQFEERGRAHQLRRTASRQPPCRAAATVCEPATAVPNGPDDLRDSEWSEPVLAASLDLPLD